MKTSERTRNHLRRLAIINGVFLLAALVIALAGYLRVGTLPEFDGQTVELARIDVELMHFKGYRVGQVMKDRIDTRRGCSWFEPDACALPIAVRGNGYTYRCSMQRDRSGECHDHYVCRPKRC